MPRYDVFLEGRAESSTRYFAVSVMADDPKEAEFLGHEAGRVKHQECDEIEVVGVMSVTSDLNAGKGRLCWRIPLKERALRFVKEAITNCRKRLIDADELLVAFGNALNNANLKIGYGFMEWVVNEQPTIDPESLRPTAKWIVVRLMADGAECKCGNCGRHETFTSFDRHTDHVYCCRCGYKMEGLTNE
jgi:hypothetical protein